MAAASWFIVFCIAGRVVLAFTSLILNFICGWSELIFLTLIIGALLLQVESSWLNHEEEEQQPQPGDIGYLVILVVCEWLLAFPYCGVAYSALTSDLASPWGGTCLAADVTAFAAGALAAVSAVGMLCVLCSRLHQAEAPLQPQA